MDAFFCKTEMTERVGCLSKDVSFDNTLNRCFPSMKRLLLNGNNFSGTLTMRCYFFNTKLAM